MSRRSVVIGLILFGLFSEADLIGQSTSFQVTLVTGSSTSILQATTPITVAIKNPGPNATYFGYVSSVTASNGFLLNQGESLIVSIGTAQTLYGISSGGSQAVSVLTSTGPLSLVNGLLNRNNTWSGTNTFNGTIAASLNNILNAQVYSGADTWAKVITAIGSAQCTNGCIVTDGDADQTAETITATDGTLTISKPVRMFFHGKYTYAGAALANGLIQINGNAANGTEISCEHFPQQLAGLNFNIIPCGFSVSPGSGTMPAIIQLKETGAGMNDVFLHDISLLANSNVTDPIQFSTTGGGGGNIKVQHVYISAASSTSSWTGSAFNLKCANAGAASNAQYGVLEFLDVTVAGPSVSPSICQNVAFSTTSSGITLDPTGGTGCGNVGPVTLQGVQMEGLTGTTAVTAKSSFNVAVRQCIFNVNNFAANSKVISTSGINAISNTIIENSQLDDNSCSGNTGVIDIALASASGSRVANNFLEGATKGTYAESDHAIDIDGSTSGVQVFGNYISNIHTAGSLINSGATGVLYCNNIFTAGIGANTEFANSLAAIPSKSCALFGNGADVVTRTVNQAFGTRAYDLDEDSSGNFKLNMNGMTLFTWSGSTSVAAANPFYFPDGTITNPGGGFTLETNSGIRRAGSHDWRWLVNGADVVRLSPSTINVDGASVIGFGTAGGVLGTLNLGISPASAGVLAVGNGTVGDFSGTIKLSGIGNGIAPNGQVGNIALASFVFANIGTFFTANGQIGYCADCTIANPCAGGGNGAIAKRLNGVNVCN